MSEIYFKIPPPIVHKFGLSSLPRSEHVGWQLKAYQIEELHGLGIDGSGIKIGVADTGISKNHSRTGGELENVVQAESFVHGPVWDRHFHGSHCQSIAQAKDNDRGMVGVAPNAIGYHAKVLSDAGSGGDRGISKGIDWLAEMGCDVISLSLGSPMSSSWINGSIRKATDAGVMVFAAAGNDGRRNHVDWPGAGDRAHAIGAHDNNLHLASFSDKGPQVVTASPGVRIYGCSVSGYTEASGTSMSTPFTAACAGLVRQAEKKAFGEIKTKTPSQFLALVRQFHKDLGPVGIDDSFGIGLFDVVRCVKWILAQDPKEPPPEKKEWKTVWSKNGYRVQELTV